MAITTVAATINPQQLIWTAMHTCYSALPEATCSLSEYKAGASVVSNLLQGNKGHWSPLEQPCISLHLAYVPHDVMQQLRTHRHLSFSVQSFRYSSAQFEAYDGEPETLAKLVYFREPDSYVDREGNRYTYTKAELVLVVQHRKVGFCHVFNGLQTI